MIELTAFRNADDEDGVRISLGHLYRARLPVVFDIGPVLHLDDLRASKVAALVARAKPRDYVDVGVFLADHSPAELLKVARTVDPGIEAEDIAGVGRRLDRMPDWEFANYGLGVEAIAEMRRRFRAWPRPEEAT